MKPALVTYQSLGLQTELGLALCFDIHVQNGGITRARQAIQAEIGGRRLAESTVRKIIATKVADSASPRFREDVLSRKMTMATGAGRVHGENFVTSDWGVGDFAVEPLSLGAGA
jgi:hypothetical protein